jgi:hypothetical protein
VTIKNCPFFVMKVIYVIMPKTSHCANTRSAISSKRCSVLDVETTLMKDLMIEDH